MDCVGGVDWVGGGGKGRTGWVGLKFEERLQLWRWVVDPEGCEVVFAVVDILQVEQHAEYAV